MNFNIKNILTKEETEEFLTNLHEFRKTKTEDIFLTNFYDSFGMKKNKYENLCDSLKDVVLNIVLEDDLRLKNIFLEAIGDFNYDLNYETFLDYFTEDFECFFYYKQSYHAVHGLYKVTFFEWENLMNYLEHKLGIERLVYNLYNKTSLNMNDFEDVYNKIKELS